MSMCSEKLKTCRYVNLSIRLRLQHFADSSDKTEKATPKKRREAREKGQVLQSSEIVSAMVLICVFLSLRVLGSFIYTQLDAYFRKVMVEYPGIEDLFTDDGLKRIFADMVMVFAVVAGPIMAVTVISGCVGSYAQVGFLFTLEPIALKLNRLNPITGLKRIFSMKGAVELLKAVLKIVIIGYIAYVYLDNEIYSILKLMDMDTPGIGKYISITSINVAVRICLALIILGLFDYGYQWWEYEKSLKMTKQELKEEYKQTEGNPEIKAKIKQKQRQLSLRRMMHEVPKADVVITNPTHYAVAIKYDAQVSDAPIVLAKGQDFIALRIKEIAKENNVEVVENKSLARTLYDMVDIGQSIPPELYQAVAEVLAFVYSIKENAMQRRSKIR